MKLGSPRLDFFQKRARTPNKHTGVPEVLPRSDVASCLCGPRLLNEFRNSMQPRMSLVGLCPNLDVSVPGVGPSRLHPQCDENIGLLRRRRRHFDRPGKRTTVRYVMVGGQDHKNAVWIFRGNSLGDPRCSHRRVTPTGFDQYSSCRKPGRLANPTGMFVPADNPDPVFTREGARTHNRGLEQARPTHNLQQRLGVARSRRRPKTFTRPPRQNNGVQRSAFHRPTLR